MGSIPIRTTMNTNWISLKEHWQHLYDVAMKRENQKKDFPTPFKWKKFPPHFIGLCGEKVFSLVFGLPVNEDLIITGDGGYDFVVNGNKINVKTTIYWHDPHLKEMINPKWWADYYFLVALDTQRKRGRLCGWASQEELYNGYRQDYGYGSRLVVFNDELHTGTLPVLT